jgi:C_GCAxxG_C_C family probable redox protein
MREKGKEEILKEVQKKAFEYEKEYYGCSQCILLAFQEAFGLENEEVFKAATCFAGGIGFKGSVCGALTGGITAIGLKHGRNIQAFLQHDPEKTRFKTSKLARKLWEKFEKTHGSCMCHDIQKRIFGKSYNPWDPKQYEQFEKDGDHCEKRCKIGFRTPFRRKMKKFSAAKSEKLMSID